MEWWHDALGWVNRNDGVINVIGSAITALFTALAALFAGVAIVRSRRKEKANLLLTIRPMALSHLPIAQQDTKVEILVECLGPASPLMIRFKRVGPFGASGDGFNELLPGTGRVLGRYERESMLSRTNITLTWLDPDGTRRRIRGSYRYYPDAPERNLRTSIRVDPETYPIGEVPRRLQRRSLVLQAIVRGRRILHVLNPQSRDKAPAAPDEVPPGAEPRF